MPSLRFFILPLFLLASISFAADAIKVEQVKFNTTKDDWIQMEIELKCEGNPLPDAKNEKFLENIKVKAYVTYSEDGAANKYAYYTSESEILIMEKGESYNVYYYLPGLIVERDRLKKDPDFYYVEISIGETVLPPLPNSMSRSIKNLTMLESMKTQAAAEGDTNANILMPIYYAPGYVLGNVSDLPTYLRRDPRP